MNGQLVRVRTAAEEAARVNAEMAAAVALADSQRKAARVHQSQFVHPRRWAPMRVHTGLNLGRLLDAQGVK